MVNLNVPAIEAKGEAPALRFSVELTSEADGRWIGEVPEVPGALGYGATKEEAVAGACRLALSQELVPRMVKPQPLPPSAAPGGSFPAGNPPLAVAQAHAGYRRVEQLKIEVDRLAEALFVAYNEQGPNPWETFDRRPVPQWSKLGIQVVEKWRAVARAATENAVRALGQAFDALEKR